MAATQSNIHVHIAVYTVYRYMYNEIIGCIIYLFTLTILEQQGPSLGLLINLKISTGTT